MNRVTSEPRTADLLARETPVASPSLGCSLSPAQPSPPLDICFSRDREKHDRQDKPSCQGSIRSSVSSTRDRSGSRRPHDKSPRNPIIW